MARRKLAKQNNRTSEQQAEWDRCALDPIYWIESKCKAFDPRERDNPYTPFILHPQQRAFIRWLDERDRTRSSGIVEKSRDSGATYMCAFYALHCWLFRSGDSTGFGSRKLDLVDKIGDPDSIFEKIRMTFRGLPEWMKPGRFVWSLHATMAKFVNPDNGSTITGEGGDDIGRGGRKSRYFVDEAAHLEHPKLNDAALSQTTNVRIDVSTPKGLNEYYFKIKEQLAAVFRLHWIDDLRKNRWVEIDAGGKITAEGTGRHPTAPIPRAKKVPAPDKKSGRTVEYPWYELQRRRPEYRDRALMAQEVDIDYVGSGNPRFNREWLMEQRDLVWDGRKYRKGWEPELVETPDNTGWSGVLTTFVQAEDDHSYVILVDTARGLTESGTSDYSVAWVVDLETCEQVAHYRGQMTEFDFANDLATLGSLYKSSSAPYWPLMVVEIPGPGEAVLSHLSNTIRYQNIYSYWDDDAAKVGGLARTGLPMSSSTKPESESKLASMLGDAEQGIRGSICIRHENSFEELVHYVKLRLGVCGAEAGGHDDECTCARLLAMVWALFTTRGKKPMSKLEPVQPKSAGRGNARPRATVGAGMLGARR